MIFSSATKKLLVTGGAGFIGGHFAQLSHSDCVCLDKITYASNFETLKILKDRRKPVPFVRADIRNTPKVIETCLKHDINTIVNFAAETHVDNSIRDAAPFVASNVDGVRSLLEVCRRTGCDMVHISTDEVYGPATDSSFKEDDKLAPKNPYSATKAAAEHLIESYRNTYGVRCMILRPTNNFGPRQNNEKFIPKFIECYMRNVPFPLYGDGKQVREWTYVKDCARIIEELIDLGVSNDVINIGTLDSSMSNLEMCTILLDKLNTLTIQKKTLKDVVSFVPDRPGHDRKYAIDISKLISKLPSLKILCTPFGEALEEACDVPIMKDPPKKATSARSSKA